ncbi:MAG: hypothetical protein K0B11_03815 [Mariniphaga sp.]|nr:hypothetical protein [Mariniphaga sp.]
MKVETVIGDLMENGLKVDDFVVVANGSFKRRYSRDIACTNKVKLNNGQEISEIHVNRDAIYDLLPEGLFHQSTELNVNESGNISRESKRLKAEEKDARIFFLPFENEIYFQRINLELEERKILNQFNEVLLDDVASGFWNFDKSIERKFLLRMIKFLHFSYKIAGNIKLTEECLGKILDEDVKITITANHSDEQVNYKNDILLSGCLLGASELGVDFVCGDVFKNTGRIMVFAIGPLRNSVVNDYLENGAISKFLACFFDFFVPVEIDVNTKILVSPEKQNFLLEESEEGASLGFKTFI